ncbi:hypothetical protein JCM14635_09650 [Megalodesulfovibrio paquesii]
MPLGQQTGEGQPDLAVLAKNHIPYLINKGMDVREHETPVATGTAGMARIGEPTIAAAEGPVIQPSSCAAAEMPGKAPDAALAAGVISCGR